MRHVTNHKAVFKYLLYKQLTLNYMPSPAVWLHAHGCGHLCTWWIRVTRLTGPTSTFTLPPIVFYSVVLLLNKGSQYFLHY